jgi:16S rRNA (cytosine1402-N4)-methyltransferase
MPAGGLRMSRRPDSPAFGHEPVMVGEIVELFRPVPAGLVVDATVGGGGHARALLEAHPHLRLLGLDRDPAALAAARHALAGLEPRVVLRPARFDHLDHVLQELGHATIVGALFDLGVSSAQLDRPERGFSHRVAAPLDMRMDPTSGRTAAEVVNEEPVEELARILRDYGDERFALRIAQAVVAARPLTTTAELADVVRDAIPAPARRRGGHPARRTFQAIRIAVNEELDQLPVALDQALDRLEPGGRCVVLSYHSGEDRRVKERFLTAASGGCACPPGLPCVCGAVPRVRLLTRGARKPRPAEVEANPRARSARLRAVERLP